MGSFGADPGALAAERGAEAGRFRSGASLRHPGALLLGRGEWDVLVLSGWGGPSPLCPTASPPLPPPRRSSRCGTGPPTCCSAPSSTPPPSTCGRPAASSQVGAGGTEGGEIWGPGPPMGGLLGLIPAPCLELANAGRPLFPGNDVDDQLKRIFRYPSGQWGARGGCRRAGMGLGGRTGPRVGVCPAPRSRGP